MSWRRSSTHLYIISNFPEDNETHVCRIPVFTTAYCESDGMFARVHVSSEKWCFPANYNRI